MYSFFPTYLIPLIRPRSGSNLSLKIWRLWPFARLLSISFAAFLHCLHSIQNTAHQTTPSLAFVIWAPIYLTPNRLHEFTTRTSKYFNPNFYFFRTPCVNWICGRNQSEFNFNFATTSSFLMVLISPGAVALPVAAAAATFAVLVTVFECVIQYRISSLR